MWGEGGRACARAHARAHVRTCVSVCRGIFSFGNIALFPQVAAFRLQRFRIHIQTGLPAKRATLETFLCVSAACLPVVPLLCHRGRVSPHLQHPLEWNLPEPHRRQNGPLPPTLLLHHGLKGGLSHDLLLVQTAGVAIFVTNIFVPFTI